VSGLLNSGANVYGGSVNDFVAVAVDPDDPELTWFGSWDDGLIEVRSGVPVQIYNQNNSSLGLDVLGFEGRLNVGGLDHDRDGNLWMTNAWSAAPLSVRTKSGTWYSYSPGSLLNNNQLIAGILAASNGFKWIVRPRGNALLVFDDNGTLEVSSDDRWKLLNSAEGSGGLPAPDVFTVAEDKEGQVWVGTSKGIAVFYTPENVFNSSGFDAQQILLEQDGNFQYLLETEAVSSIVVDGANRKWIGTQTGGVFLVSPDGRTEILHFTQDNSPLPSNTVYAITVDEGTGEVFMATDRGIMSYRGDAIEGLAENTCATVFPNPVNESYTGPVAIDGLVRDSEVKITDVSGNLVYRTTSLGGQALWPATDMEGNRVSTGVYLIFAADQFGNTKCNTKVLVVR
jgi:ligand-binding sensor domain-containing protein